MPPLLRPTSPKLTADWRPGPRTPAWSELWRRLLAEAVQHSSAANEIIVDQEIPNQWESVEEVDTDVS